MDGTSEKERINIEINRDLLFTAFSNSRALITEVIEVQADSEFDSCIARAYVLHSNPEILYTLATDRPSCHNKT